MSVKIPYIHDLKPAQGEVEEISPLVRRVLCNNPSPYTYTGTGTFIIGSGDSVAVIDPGPNNDEHLENILSATSGERISHILVTHTHADHSPLANPLAKQTGAKIYAFADDSSSAKAPSDVESEEGVDKNFSATNNLSDGDMLSGNGWTINAIHTPGHTSNHMCFELVEEHTLFSGDHIMAWSTSIIIPPDGVMADYMMSLEKLLHKNYKIIRPCHGPAIIEVNPFIEALIAHRIEREGEIISAVAAGNETVMDIVLTVYKDLPKELINAASMSCLAQLILLVDDGRVKCKDKPSLASRYILG